MCLGMARYQRRRAAATAKLRQAFYPALQHTFMMAHAKVIIASKIQIVLTINTDNVVFFVLLAYPLTQVT